MTSGGKESIARQVVTSPLRSSLKTSPQRGSRKMQAYAQTRQRSEPQISWCPNESARSPGAAKGTLGRGSQGSTTKKTGQGRLKNCRQESKENEDLINCLGSNIVHGSGVVSLASGRRALAEEPEYRDRRQGHGDQGTVRSAASGAMEDTYNSLRPGQPRARNDEHDTVSSPFSSA